MNKIREMKPIPNPGSNDAVRRGCTCPILDNSKGWGYFKKDSFWITQNCPLHDKTDYNKNSNAVVNSCKHKRRNDGD